LIIIDNNDGKTKETAIKILDAKDHREGWEFIYDYMDRHQAMNGYKSWDREDYSTQDGHGFLKELAVFRFIVDNRVADEIWFDWTELFHIWDK
jgi:hypothetical protein